MRNCADDSTLYASGKYLSIITENFKANFEGFPNAFTKMLWFLTLINVILWYKGDSGCTFNFACNGTTIESSKEENVLGIKIDDKLTFMSHLTNIKKSNQKLHALSRVKCYMRLEQN